MKKLGRSSTGTGLNRNAPEFLWSPPEVAGAWLSSPPATTALPEPVDNAPSPVGAPFIFSAPSPKAAPMPPTFHPEQRIPSPEQRTPSPGDSRISVDDASDADGGIDAEDQEPQRRSWSPPPVLDSSQIQSATKKVVAKLDAYSSTRRELLDILTSLHSTG